MPYKYNPLTKKLDYYEAGASSMTLDNINDVSVSGATQDQVLAYNASSGTWTPATISSGVSALDDLSDVSTAGASQDQVLSYNPSTGSWSPTTIDGSGGAITTDTTYYVDGDNGDDSNDGSSWANAKKTFDFLYSGSSSAISREIRAAVTINVRGTVLSAGTERHFHADDFYGNGTITIVGETQNEVTGLTPTGYNNTVSDQRYHQYIEVSGAGWTPNDYKGMFIQFTSPASDTLYPIIENTADTLETTALPDLAGTETFKIVSITSKFKSAEVTDPGTPLLYGYWHFFNIENNTIPFRFQKLDIDSEAPTVKSYLFTSYGAAGNFDDSLWTYGGFYVENCMIGGLWHRTPDFVNVRRCYCNLEDYSGIFLDRRGYIYQSVVVSNAGTGNGILAQTGAAINVEQSRITEQRIGLFVSAQGHLTIQSSELKDNGTAVLISQGSIVACNSDLSGPLSFIDNTKAIVRSRGGSLFLQYSENYYYSGNTYDIQWNHDPDLMISFADYFAGVKVEDMSIRGPNGNPSYVPDSINNDMTFYVDGSTGSDTKNGTSWANAKKTFSFLYSGGTHALPREINSTITIYCRNTIYMHEANKNIYIDNMHGSGQIVIEGVPTTIQSAITPTGWDNTKSSTTYRTYVEASGESWTPEEHVSRFIERTSNTGTYYPIIENTATRLEGVAIPITNGSHTFNIVEMPQLAGALVTDTGTPIISYTDNQIDLYKSSIDVTISNLNAFNADGSVSSIDLERYSGDADFYSVFSRIAIFSQSSGNMYLRRCGIYDDETYAAGWYTIWSNGTPFLRDTALRGPDDGTGWGLYWSQGLNGYSRVYNVRVKDYANGMYSEIASSLINLDGTNLIEGATVGLGLEASTVELGIYSSPTEYLHFLDCTTGIHLQAGKIKKETSVEFNASSVTTEILLANSPANVTETFANANAEAAIYNAATGAGILYYDPSAMTFTVPTDYDNSSSGLSANTLQDAIDEIAGASGVPIEDTDVDSGSDELLDSFSASSYDACWWEYVLWNTNSGTSKRAGIVTATWDDVGGTVEYFDSSTNDIGDTSDAVLSVTHNASSGEIQLLATMSTDNWTVKVRRRPL